MELNNKILYTTYDDETYRIEVISSTKCNLIRLQEGKSSHHDYEIRHIITCLKDESWHLGGEEISKFEIWN